MEKIGPLFWHYRRFAPQSLTFSVTYFPKDSEIWQGPGEEEQRFLEYCSAAGWTLAAEWNQMRIFYTERETVPIDTDETVKLKVIHKIMKRTFLPHHYVMALIGICDVFLQIVFGERIFLLAYWLGILMTITGLLYFLTSMSYLYGYWTWYYDSKRSVEEGGPCVDASRRIRIVEWADTFYMALLILVAAARLAEFAAEEDTATKQGRMPLRIENLVDSFEEDSRYSWEERETCLIYYGTGWQESEQYGSITPGLSYTVVEVKWEPLYEPCLEELRRVVWWGSASLTENRQPMWQEAEHEAWMGEADIVYQCFEGPQPLPNYILCWEDRMLKLRFLWEPGTEELEKAVRRCAELFRRQ